MSDHSGWTDPSPVGSSLDLSIGNDHVGIARDSRRSRSRADVVWRVSSRAGQCPTHRAAPHRCRPTPLRGWKSAISDRIEPTTSGHVNYPGTISLETSTFIALLTEIARSYKAHGFADIILTGDSGGNRPE